MVQDMTSDNGSVVSFDRQSSGKYSFKIPRPFMPLIKDWDTEHMSYANSVFTSDTHDTPKGDRTLRSSRSITLPDESDPEGYNRPHDRQLSLSTASTIDAEMTDIQSVGDSPKSVEKTYEANDIDIESDNIDV